MRFFSRRISSAERAVPSASASASASWGRSWSSSEHDEWRAMAWLRLRLFGERLAVEVGEGRCAAGMGRWWGPRRGSVHGEWSDDNG